jgi:hypothetical protein
MSLRRLILSMRSGYGFCLLFFVFLSSLRPSSRSVCSQIGSPEAKVQKEVNRGAFLIRLSSHSTVKGDRASSGGP